MPSLALVAGSGHCGTKWLSSVLDAQPGVRFYHELRPAITQTAWFRLAEYAPDAPVYHGYWGRIWRELDDGEVGDANSWAPWQIPAVARLIEVGVIYLVRNGIQQLHSLATCSGVWREHPLDGFAFDVWLREMWRACGEPDPPYDEWSRWERLCLLVKANGCLPDWLRQQGLDVTTVRLEDLTTDVDALQAVAPGLSRQELRQWQQRDINRKVQGDRTPATLWGQWTGVQRAAFRRICGDEMASLDYEIPGE